MKGVIPPSSSAVTNVYIRSITWPGHPKSKCRYLKKKKIPDGLRHLNSKLRAERQGKPICYFLKTSLPLSPPLASSELKKLPAKAQATPICVLAPRNAATSILAKETQWPKAGTPGWEQYPAQTQSQVCSVSQAQALPLGSP